MFALIVDGLVRETTDEDPAGRYHPSLTWVPVPDGADVSVGWSYTGHVFSAPVPVLRPVPPLAPRAFMDRFTASEEEAIYGAAMGNKALLKWLFQAAAGSVDLTDAKTREGIGFLVQAGLLTSGRGTEILTP